MHRLYPILLLLPLFACGRDPLSVKEISVATEMPADGLEAAELADGATELLPAHEDLTFRLSYLLGENAGARLMLQGRYAIDLEGITLAGGAPRLPATLSAGVWHDLEVVFAAGKEASPPIVTELYVDGNLMHYQQPLAEAGATRPGPLTVERRGEVTIKELRYAKVAGTGSRMGSSGDVNLTIPLLAYRSYALPAQTEDFRGWEVTTPTKRGYAGRFDILDHHPGSDAYAIRYEGQLDVPKAGRYVWKLWGPTLARLYIDGEEIVGKPGQPTYEAADSLELTRGVHEVALEYVNRGGWHPIEVAYRYEDQEERYLNTMERDKQIARPAGTDPVAIQTDDRPYILRSFLEFPTPKVYAEAKKRTHVVSVGEGDGPHYSVDLQSGGLLQVWRGPFADVRDMWVGRGEPQVMRALGPAIAFDGAMQWAADPELAWPNRPELPDEDDFQHEAYELDDRGRPTFTYRFGSARVTDKLTPTEAGLTRELSISGGGADGYTPLAVADEITEVAPGEFVLRGPGARIRIDAYDGEGLFMQVSGGKDRLIAHLGDRGILRYSLDW